MDYDIGIRLDATIAELRIIKTQLNWVIESLKKGEPAQEKKED